MSAKVLIVDDHRLLRDGLRKTVMSHGMQVVGEATDGEEAVKMALALLPDVVLMDVSMPYRDGIEATRLIKEVHADMPVIILTMHIDEEVQQDASDVGADAYLFKDCSASDIIETIQELFPSSKVTSAGPSEDDSTEKRVTEEGPAQQKNDDGSNDTTPEAVTEEGGSGTISSARASTGLSTREIEVLQLTADGLSISQIADSLDIAERTVRNHLGGTYTKLGVSDKAQALIKAIQLKLIFV